VNARLALQELGSIGERVQVCAEMGSTLRELGEPLTQGENGTLTEWERLRGTVLQEVTRFSRAVVIVNDAADPVPANVRARIHLRQVGECCEACPAANRSSEKGIRGFSCQALNRDTQQGFTFTLNQKGDIVERQATR